MLCNHFVVSKCEPLTAPHYVTCNLNESKSKMIVGATRGGRIWTISGEEMEEVKAFKCLGVWFDRSMGGNVQLEKMKEKAEERAVKTMDAYKRWAD